MSYDVLNLFHDKPGRWERHLQRKYQNPLFADHQSITKNQITQAQAKDAAELVAFDQAFRQMIEKTIALPDNAPSETVLALKEDIDKLYETSARLRADQTDKQQALIKLMAVISKTVQVSAGNDAFANSQLAQENLARVAHFELLRYPIVADILGEDSPIQAHELTPTLLIESERPLQAVMGLFEVEQKRLIFQEGTDALATLKDQGIDIPFADERLQEIGALV